MKKKNQNQNQNSQNRKQKTLPLDVDHAPRNDDAHSLERGVVCCSVLYIHINGCS